jgi:UDP-2,3-diacylglucosamine hydrolase
VAVMTDRLPEFRLGQALSRWQELTYFPMKLGLIAGNGKFPFLVLEAARAQGFEVVVAAIREEAFPEIAREGAASVHWLSLGELSKLIDTFKARG